LLLRSHAGPYDLAAQAARKGKELMEAAQQKKAKKQADIGVKLKTAKGRQMFAEEIVEYMLKQKIKHDDERARERRYGAALLPGFEDLNKMREDAYVAHFATNVGGWQKGDVALEKTRSANVRATVNAGKRGDEAAKLIAKLKKEREEANASLKAAQNQTNPRKPRKSRLTWGKSDDEDDSASSSRERPQRRTMRQTFSKMLGFGGSSVIQEAKRDAEQEDEEETPVPGSAPSATPPPTKTMTKPKALKDSKKKGSSMFGFFSTPATRNRALTSDAAESGEPAPADPSPDELIDKVAGLAAMTVQATAELDAATAAPRRGMKAGGGVSFGGDVIGAGESKGIPEPALKSEDDVEKEGEDADNSDDDQVDRGREVAHPHHVGHLPERKVHLLVGQPTKINKTHDKHIHENGGSKLRRNDFLVLPGFEHGHHVHKHKHLMNFDNDLL
jgi:hypothetical protein